MIKISFRVNPRNSNSATRARTSSLEVARPGPELVKTFKPTRRCLPGSTLRPPASSKARSRGLATLLCEHSQQLARELGYKAMQFNLVVTTNTVSAHLWSKLGFDTVGRLPGAFKHPTKGFVDALVMYKILD